MRMKLRKPCLSENIGPGAMLNFFSQCALANTPLRGQKIDRKTRLHFCLGTRRNSALQNNDPSPMPTKTKAMTDSQFLALLEKVLPKVAKDPHLCSTIYEEVAREMRLLNSLQSFEKFCEKGALPD